MAYIAVRKNREGKEYVYLVEGYRVGNKVRNRILEKYGKLEDLEAKESGILERLRREAKSGKLLDTSTPTLETSINLKEEISFTDKNYGWKLLDAVYEMLDISSITQKVKGSHEFDLDRLLKLLVYQRVIDPGSKLRAINHQSLLWGEWNFGKDDVYRGLSLLEPIKREIQLACHESITKHMGRNAMLVFYDVTNYYFETDLDDTDSIDEETGEITEGLRRRGASKEKRPKPIVQMGLFMDSNGIPISYELFRGNATDPTTYLPAIEQVKKQFGIDRIVVVADKAMNSKGNVSATNANGDGWLFSQKHRGKRGASKAIQSFILDETGWQYNEALTFSKKSMIHKRQLETTDKSGKKQKSEVEEKVVVTWNKTYAVREKLRRDGALEYIEKLTNPERFRASCKRGGKKYIEMYEIDKKTGEKKPLSPFLDIDRQRVEFDEQFDGIHVLVTSEVNMSDDEIIKQYGELSKIEDCFKVTKTDCETRPVYVRRNDRIEAHFLTCYLALTIIRIIQVKAEWKMSASRIIEALQSARCNQLGNGYVRVQASQNLQKLHTLLKINWTKANVKAEALNKYAQSWCTTFSDT